MALKARNESELRAAIIPKIREAVEYVMQMIEQDNRALIAELVYGAYNPEIYQREGIDGGFQSAWEYTMDTKDASGRVTGQFHYEPDNMTPWHYSTADGMYHHGSPSTEWGDVRDYLADIIYHNGMEAGPLYGDGPWRKKRDAWSALIKKLGVQQFDRYMQAGFAKAGLPVKKTGRSIRI